MARKVRLLLAAGLGLLALLLVSAMGLTRWRDARDPNTPGDRHQVTVSVGEGACPTVTAAVEDTWWSIGWVDGQPRPVDASSGELIVVGAKRATFTDAQGRSWPAVAGTTTGLREDPF